MRRAVGEVQIDGVVFPVGVPHQKPDGPQLRSRLHPVRGEAVPQGVRSDPFLDARPSGRLLAGVPNDLVGDRSFHTAMFPAAGEQIDLRSLPAPVFA